MMCLSKSQDDVSVEITRYWHHDVLSVEITKDADIMMMCLSKSQQAGIMMMCLSKSQDDVSVEITR